MEIQPNKLRLIRKNKEKEKLKRKEKLIKNNPSLILMLRVNS
jgi:hypothetical protein